MVGGETLGWLGSRVDGVLLEVSDLSGLAGRGNESLFDGADGRGHDENEVEMYETRPWRTTRDYIRGATKGRWTMESRDDVTARSLTV